MAKEPGAFGRQRNLQKGESCLLKVMDEYYLVHILETTKTTLRVSFPGRDYPVAGMTVTLEFHDEKGFDYYEAEVLEGPSADHEWIVLTKPPSGRRSRHRDWCRVPTDLTVQVKDWAHPRRYDASVKDLSAGGLLIESSAPFDLDTTVEVTLSLPNQPTHTALARVVHILQPPAPTGNSSRLFGLQFINLEPVVGHAIALYVWSRLEELYSGG